MRAWVSTMNPKTAIPWAFLPHFIFTIPAQTAKQARKDTGQRFSSSKLLAGNYLKVVLLADHSVYKPDSGLLNRTFVSLSPSYSLKDKKWFLNLGLGLTYYNDTAEEKMYVFPRVEFNYRIDSNHTASVGMTGDYRKNSYRSLSEENPFISDEITLKNTINQFELHAGIRGRLSNKLSYFAAYRYSLVQNLHFFVTDSTAFQAV
jgi:hypothetical protein